MSDASGLTLGLDSTYLIAILSTVIPAVLYLMFRRQNLCPGPTGLPYFGLWPFLKNKTCHLELHEMSKKYGDVFCFTYTGHVYIHLGSIKAVREAHIAKSDCFEQRMEAFSLFQHIFADGLSFTSGEAWKSLRKFFIQTMKVRGVKALTDSLSGSLYDLMNSTVEELRERKGEATDIIRLLTNKSTTTLRLTLFGEGLTDEQITEIIEMYEGMVASMTPLNTLLIGNFAKYVVCPLKPEVRAMMKHFKMIKQILYKIIDQHKATYNEYHIRDVIDEFLKERNDRKIKNDPTANHFTDKALMSSLIQFVGDGVLSVSFFASILIACLVKHPEEQDKIFQELSEVVGEDRLPSVEDKARLPYMNAFLLEVMRTSDIMPIFASVECTKETTLRGHRIPKGAITLPNLWSCHYDPAVYDDPKKFNPSRFLAQEDKRKPENPIFFGVGKRACLGEGFTMTQIFLFLAAIIKNFHLSLPEGQKVSIFELLETGKMDIHAVPRVRQ